MHECMYTFTSRHDGLWPLRSVRLNFMAQKPKARSTSQLTYEPQLATLVEQPPGSDDWLHEQKFDGYRIGLRKGQGTVTLWSRRNLDWTAEFASVAAAGAELDARIALLDGEVAVLLPSGVTSFQGLQNRRPGTSFVYFAFDLIHLDGQDLHDLPIEDRKRQLQALLARGSGGGAIRFSDHVIGGGPAFFEKACELGLEGMVSKRLGTKYRAGRNMDWLKTKCLHRQEFVIGGFTDPEKSRQGVGALLIGVYAGSQLRWAGKVGTGVGWNATYLRELRARLNAVAAPASPFTPPVSDSWLRKNAHWVRPELVLEVTFSEWTKDGHVRHPSAQGLRSDKAPRDVILEAPADQPTPPRRRR